jgi:predicted double-glycine peptidase
MQIKAILSFAFIGLGAMVSAAPVETVQATVANVADPPIGHVSSSSSRNHDYNREYNRDYNHNYNRDYNRNYNHNYDNRNYDNRNYNHRYESHIGKCFDDKSGKR